MRAAAMAVATVLALAGAGFDGARAAPTAAQRAWLAQTGPIRFAPERDYGPFVYQEPDGTVAGLSLDLLRMLQRRSGLDIRMLPAAPLHVQLDAARRRDADLLSSLRQTPERAVFLRFTRPYVSVPAILVVGDGATARGLGDLAGQPVAVGKGYAVESVMRQRHPAVRWQAVDDDAAALGGVAEGRWSAAVVDAASAAFVQRRLGLDGLRAVGQVGFDYELSFAVRSDWPELQAILDAAIHDLPPAERRAAVERWLPAPGSSLAAPRAPVATRVAVAMLVAAVGLAGVGWWQARRRRRADPSR